ncbi:FitA-like ribbon-helix-helix domain-containing protein [Candidatus Leptofilum sp.]|uniref:FitA-like ribbon-helix-helix domain-containing protein n=1 Tax=Candidatus Leptofilum sp. TaxID=3241576 RepID=UPI003B5AAADA
MATLTIRNLDNQTKQKLRQLAATRGHSMEEEVRRILARAVQQAEEKGLGTRIVEEFAAIGGVEFELPARSPTRPAPNFEEPA